MRMEEALIIIDRYESRNAGYRVVFERLSGNMLGSGYFPEVGQDVIATEAEAWALATRFAAATYGEYINIYVVHEDTFFPVPGYESRRITNR